MQRGARQQKLANDGMFVYMRHGANAWAFAPGRHIDAGGWRRAGEPALPAEDRAFYAARSAADGRAATQPASPPAVLRTAESTPVVSCIMPTYNRRRFAGQAIAYFLRQDYPHCELIILDDGDDAVQDLVPNDPRVRYVRLSQRVILGAKRNLACTLAQGSIIAHWDDDDWMAPHRLRYQVAFLEAARADLCGADRQIYYDPHQARAWLYEYPLTRRRWVAGNTLCYRKQFWETNRFPEISVGEDTRFVLSPRARNVAVTPESDFYIGLMHEANTSAKMTNGAYWKPHSVDDVRRLLGNDWAFYQSLKGSST